MPRRKKNGQSPARVPGGPSEGGSLRHNMGYRLPQGFDGAMTNNFPTSTPYSSSDKEKIVKSMQEMFSHLDPEVIYIVLSESDFKVENAMDSLLELSVAADVATPTPSHVSGFERTAAALLSPCHFSEPRPDPESSEPSQLASSPPTTNLLTEELDLLVDQELETLTAQQGFNDEHHSSQYLSVGTTLPSVPQPPTPQQVLPELLQSSLVPGSRGPFGGDLLEYNSGASCPLNQPSIREDKTTKEPQSVVDFTHLMTEMPVDKTVSPLDLASSGRSSAFQVYKKQEPSHTPSDKAEVMPSQAVVRGASSKVNQEPLGYSSSQWNLQAPVFSPHIHGNQGPAFIIPVAQAPSNWPRQPRHASPWLIQAPLKPFASVPKSWSQPTAPHPPTRYSRLRLEGRLLVLLRGAPGSGKTTLAKALLEYNPGGIILSTDDYFTRNGAYQFDPTALGEAHHWNYKRAKEAFEMGVTPIIIDNTNMQGWEMKPYVAQAQKSGYKVLFREPDTWWKNKPRELERRTTHNVPVEKIRRMLNNYERNVTISSIMGSQTPEIKQRFLQENTSPQPAAETACPDLVGQPGSTEEYKKSHPELCSSLPDVSSIGRSSEMGILEDGSYKSTESLNFQSTGRLQENPELTNRDDDIDMGELDSELDTYLEVNHPIGDKGIPDCIVESVMGEDYHGDEIPVAFSESIAQRVRRERPSRISGFERLEPADLVKDTNQSDSKADKKEKPKEVERVEMVRDEGEKEMMLDFAGHWPCDVGSLEQRQVRRRQRYGKEDGEGVSEEADKTKSKLQPGPNVTEFQKLLDFIQTGVADLQTGSPHPSSFSQSSGEELEKDEEACGLFEESHGSRSNSEERVQNMNRVDSSRDELPDCVLDWKAADSCKVMESRIDVWDGLKTESDARSPTGGNGNMLAIESETDCMDLKATSSNNPLSDPLVISKPMEAKVCHDGVESHYIEGEDGTEPAAGHSNTNKNNSDKNGRASRAEADGSNISEECQSPVCEGSVEAESSVFSGGSQERKHRQGRRSGKQCKLALTFTQNCTASSLNTLECPSTMVHSINTDVENDFNPNWSLTSDSTEAKLESHLQPPSPLPLGDTDYPTQTEPHDFALLWRLNRQDSPDDGVATACNCPGDITVLSGDSCRFVPELSTVVSAAAAVHPSGHREVPYHMVHEKGTQVEEKELGNTQDRLESLRILSRHFKLVSFDTLEDLYDKCHQDLEWTTNLLLDSGERFFRDDDGDREGEDDARGEDITLSESAGARLCSNVIDEYHPEGWPEGEPTGFEEVTQQSAFGTVGESDGCAAVQVRNKDHPDATSPLKTSSQANVSLPHEVHEREGCGDTENKVTSEAHLEGSAWGGSLDDGVITEESRVEMEEEMANMDEVHRLLQAELEDMEREQKQKKEEERTQRRHVEERRSRHMDIQSVELKLPTEVALQLIELFGPIGVDLGTCLTDDYAVQMDLNLAKLLHQKWKETIQEKKRQARLSFHLLQESSVHWGEPPAARLGSHDRTQPARFLISADGYASLDSQPEAHNPMPLMDHWNVSRPHVSLRDIIKEEQALQENVGKTRQIRDGAALLKENQLYSLFPNIDRHFLQDIFRDHNYSLTQTELFLRSLLEEEPVKTVVAPEAPRSDHVRAASKEREKRQKPLELPVLDYQDTEDPEYEDFRAEANQQRRQQLESFSKAAEAYKQGRKDVASFYAQQGHLHGQRMREANHRAAVQIFQRVNSSLLPRNILDLHGLHVDEALEHLAQVLQDKTADCEQGLCRPQLSVITGRGNHSQGGVARIRPAVIDYLTSKHYRFTEPKPGHVLVSLK